MHLHLKDIYSTWPLQLVTDVLLFSVLKNAIRHKTSNEWMKTLKLKTGIFFQLNCEPSQLFPVGLAMFERTRKTRKSSSRFFSHLRLLTRLTLLRSTHAQCAAAPWAQCVLDNHPVGTKAFCAPPIHLNNVITKVRTVQGAHAQSTGVQKEAETETDVQWRLPSDVTGSGPIQHWNK